MAGQDWLIGYASICNSFFMNSASNLSYNISLFQNRDISESVEHAIKNFEKQQYSCYYKQ